MKTIFIEQKRKVVAEILLNKRNELGISQDQLGEIVGCKSSTIEKIESHRFSPNADQLYAICEALEIKIQLDGKEV